MPECWDSVEGDVTVVTTTGTGTVGGHFAVEDGHLYLFDLSDRLYACYAPDCWASVQVTPDE